MNHNELFKPRQSYYCWHVLLVKRKLGISLVYNPSATPFFLRGSGYVEGHCSLEG
jgi:hypothetical protein